MNGLKARRYVASGAYGVKPKCKASLIGPVLCVFCGKLPHIATTSLSRVQIEGDQPF